MIELHAWRTSNGLRARIALEECGLPYTLRVVDITKGEQKSPAFLALNPAGKIPLLVDPNGPAGRTLTLLQSTAILLYCAEKTGRFLPPEAERPALMQALMSVGSDVTPNFSSLLAMMRLPQPHAPSVELFRSRWDAYLEVWDRTLANHRYCLGDDLTIADFSLYAGYVVPKLMFPEICANSPNIDRFAEEIGARPGVKRALAF